MSQSSEPPDSKNSDSKNSDPENSDPKALAYDSKPASRHDLNFKTNHRNRHQPTRHQTLRTTGLKILFGPKYWLWKYDETKLSFVTPYFLSEQMSRFAHQLYTRLLKPPPGFSLTIWDMFGGIGTDSVYLSRYFNVISTELDSKIHRISLHNIQSFNCQNVNLINDNCINLLNKIQPDLIYFDPPWGDSYRNKIKNFDFSQVYIDFPAYRTDHYPYLPKKVSCLDLLEYIYRNLTSNIIIKSPINSNTFERAFQNQIEYIHKCPNKNLKFIYLR